MIRLALLMGVLLGGATAEAGMAETKEVRFEASGSGFDSQEADADGNLTGGSVSVGAGRDSLGRFTFNGVGDLADWDGVSFCDFDPETGYPSGVLLYYVALSQVLRYENGDLLLLELAGSPPSTLCFNFVDYVSYTFETYTEIVGGTGRLEGASGAFHGQGRGQNLQHMGAFSASGTGEVHLPRGHGRDK